jgi:hypothetical protein
MSGVRRGRYRGIGASLSSRVAADFQGTALSRER